MLSLFRCRSPAPRLFRPPVLEVGLVGRSHVGKSVMLDVLTGLPLERPLPSGLRLDIPDPRHTALAIHRREKAEADLRRRGKLSTLAPTSRTLSLFDGLREVAVLHLRDAVGQVLTKTTPDAPAALQDRYDNYVAALAGSDILL